MKIDVLGKHILIEYYNCNPEILKDHELVEDLMNEAASIAGCTIVNSVFHKFNPYGVSGAVIVQESHLTIHTWPEYNYAAVDVFICGDEIYPWKAQKFLEKKLQASKSDSVDLQRGSIKKILHYKE